MEFRWKTWAYTKNQIIMALSPFLENLKKSVDTGEFNSEAAKKIIEIDKQADIAKSEPIPHEAWDKAEEAWKAQSVTEEEAAIINADYEKNMQLIKEKDLEHRKYVPALKQIAILKDIDETVMLSIYDMRDFVKTLEDAFDKTKEVNVGLFDEIEKVKTKYGTLINN